MRDATTSEYLKAAKNAAHLEREGQFEVAEKYWKDAALVAIKKENKLWAEHRADICDKKKLRPSK